MQINHSVSVIVPMYKVERYIKFCVDSILNQTFQDFEIILVDDASPDNCFNLCQKLYGDNGKVKLIRHEKNLGLGPARNTGMKNARGKYIFFVDSDDYILPEALEKFYNVAEKTNAQVVHAAGHYSIVQEIPNPVPLETLQIKWDKHSKEGFLPTDPLYRLEEHWRKRFTQPMAWLYFCRRDFLEKNNIEFLPIISEDDPFSIALCCLAERYYILHESFYVYRVRKGSIMKTKNVEQFSKSIRSIMLGTNYAKNFLDNIPHSQNYDQKYKGILNESFGRFIRYHTLPYYKKLVVSPEIEAATEDFFKKFFGDNASFVKYFFNNYHIYRCKFEEQEQQKKSLANKLQDNLLEIFIRNQSVILELLASIKSNDKRIFLMGTPQHSNIGDHAIVLGELHILKKYFPEHKIIEIPYDYLTGELGKLFFGLGFEKYIRQDDIIFLVGGGNLGNLWLHEEKLRRKIIEKFPENKLVIFPQSIHFTDDDAGRKETENSQKIYNAHKDLHLMTRDRNSFELAQKIFPAIKNYFLPDSATVLLGITDDVDDARAGVLFILRGDKEKIRDDKKIQRLHKYLAEKNISFEVTDTVIGGKITADIREKKVREVLLKIRKSKLVVTDRLHGVIFSFITRTPVLALKSFDTKISSGIKWFKNLPSIFYIEDPVWSNVENFIDKYCFAAAEEKNSAALNFKFETDSQEKFFNALNEIVNMNPPPVYLKRLTSSTMNRAA